MKTKLIGVCICILVSFGGVKAEEYRTFKVADGRALEAKIVDFKKAKGTIVVERKDGKRISVKPSVFCEEDQAYINEWIQAEAFTSARKFKISAEDKVVGSRKEEQHEDVRVEGEGLEKMLLKTTAFEDVAFEITLQNMGEGTLSGLRMEYIVYYEQSEETWEKPIPSLKKAFGKLDISDIAPRKKIMLKTDPVTIFTDSINEMSWVNEQKRTGGKGEVVGLRARIYMTGASGTEFMREFTEPEKLSAAKYGWKTE